MDCLVLCLTDSCLLFKTNLRCTSSRKASLNSLPFSISSACSCFFSSGSEGSSLATYLKYSRHSVKVCYMNEWRNAKSLAVAAVGYVPVCIYMPYMPFFWEWKVSMYRYRRLSMICWSFFFFNVDHFLKSLLKLLQYCFCFTFWFFGHKACGIPAPWPGIELLDFLLWKVKS